MAVYFATVFEALMYEYAKLIADSALAERPQNAPALRAGDRYWSFVLRTYKKLCQREIGASAILRENKLLVAQGHQCAYCGATAVLQWEHIVPLSRGGPDEIGNLVAACATCNGQKGARNPIEWYELRGLGREHIPRLVMGKLLKLVLEEHGRRGSLAMAEYPAGQGLRIANVCLVFDGRKRVVQVGP
jgi:hypothetical protein